MSDPIWKRSGFAQWVLAILSAFIYYWMDGKPIGSEDVIGWIVGALMLLGYQVGRPTTYVPNDEILRARVAQLIADYKFNKE